MILTSQSFDVPLDDNTIQTDRSRVAACRKVENPKLRIERQNPTLQRNLGCVGHTTA